MHFKWFERCDKKRKEKKLLSITDSISHATQNFKKLSSVSALFLLLKGHCHEHQYKLKTAKTQFMGTESYK